MSLCESDISCDTVSTFRFWKLEGCHWKPITVRWKLQKNTEIKLVGHW